SRAMKYDSYLIPGWPTLGLIWLGDMCLTARRASYPGNPVRTAKSAVERWAKPVCISLAILALWATAADATNYCIKDPRIEAVDLSAPVNQSFLNQMQA